MTASTWIFKPFDNLEQEGTASDPRKELMSFLSVEEDTDLALNDVRIILVAADFSKELTTAVLWLNDRGLDIRCIRFRPYREERIIPVKEAEEYTIRLREKHREQREATSRRGTMEAFRSELVPELEGVVRQLFDWLEGRFDLWAGQGSVVPTLTINRVEHRMFRLRTDGQVAVYFDWMSRKPPFDSDALREELRRRLIAIPGIDFAESFLKRRPPFDLRVLEREDAMERFQAVVDWWIEQVRASHSDLGVG